MWGIADFSQIRSSIVPSFQGLLRFLTFPVLFDTTTYLTRASDFTSNADTQFATISFWFNISTASTGDGTGMIIYSNSSDQPIESTVSIQRSAGGRFLIDLQNSTAFITPAFSASLGSTATNVYTSTNGGIWHHLMFSITSSGATVHSYIDGVSVTQSSTTINNVTIDYTRTDHLFAGARSSVKTSTSGGGSVAGLLDVNIANFYFNTQSYLDLSQSSNRLLFRTQSGGPADMGSSGATPTASSPMIYLTGPASIFQNNVGYGGAFSAAAGAILNSTTAPSG